MRKKNKSTINVLVVDEGSPGHVAQSYGIVDLMTRRGLILHVETLKIKNRLPGFLRPLLRCLLKYPIPLLDKLFSYFIYRNPLRLINSPTVIISSGGKSAFASIMLKRRYCSFSIYVGVPHPYPDFWYDLIISPLQLSFKTQSVVSRFIPNTVTPDRALLAAKNSIIHSRLTDENVYCLLVGGDSRSHHFSRSDWFRLIDFINKSSDINGVKWLITTSRRTSMYVEEILSTHVNKSSLIELVLYNRNPRKVVLEYIGLSKYIFVTQDSLTMASEAICSGKAVFLVRPSDFEVPSDSFIFKMLRSITSIDGVEAVSTDELLSFSHCYPTEGSVGILERFEDDLIASLTRQRAF